MSELFYTPPSDEVFNKLKDACRKVWAKYKDNPGNYYEKKMRYLDEIKNVDSNFMWMVAQFDIDNMRELASYLDEDVKKEIRDRYGEDNFYYNIFK